MSIHPADSVYTNYSTVSTKNFTNREKGKASPSKRKQGFIEILNKIVDLYDGNESEVARKAGVDPQYINRWRRGHGPTKAGIRDFLAKFNVAAADLEAGTIDETAIAEQRRIDAESTLSEPQQALVDRIKKLVKNDFMFNHLLAQVDICEGFLKTTDPGIDPARDLEPLRGRDVISHGILQERQGTYRRVAPDVRQTPGETKEGSDRPVSPRGDRGRRKR